MVQDFHRKFELPMSEKPEFRDETLRMSLIMEEVLELEDAVNASSMVDAIDALCDLLYVTYGAATAWGIDLEPFFLEVHRSNMRKERGNFRGDGKLLKPPSWRPPELGPLLEEQQRGLLR
jgi:predicted HAD superfamily Cof-like phosphohydrolase